MSFKIDKELDGDPMLMHKSRHIHYESIKNLSVDENRLRFHNEPLEGYNGHDWDMNEIVVNEEDSRMDTNPTNNEQVTQIGSFRTSSTHSAQIMTIIDIDDGFMHDNSTKIQCVANEGQNMK